MARSPIRYVRTSRIFLCTRRQSLVPSSWASALVWPEVERLLGITMGKMFAQLR